MQIQLKVEIDEKEGSAVLDFEGTGCEIRGNLNAPISVVHSAVIYCMRAMLDMDIPLNAGCLVPITGACVSPIYSRLVLTLPSCSQDSRGVTPCTFPHCCSVRWQRLDVAADCGCCSQGVPRMRCQSGMHQVCSATSVVQ